MTPFTLILDSTAMVIADFLHPRSITRVPHARFPPPRILTLPPHQSTIHILTIDAHRPTRWQPLLSNQSSDSIRCTSFSSRIHPVRIVLHCTHYHSYSKWHAFTLLSLLPGTRGHNYLTSKHCSPTANISYAHGRSTPMSKFDSPYAPLECLVVAI